MSNPSPSNITLITRHGWPEIFIKWVKKEEKKMLRKKRKIAVIVDNCPAHQKIAGLKAVELVFLPPNTTSKTQPMDHGIILNLKVHYLKRVLLSSLSQSTEMRPRTSTYLTPSICWAKPWTAWHRLQSPTASDTLALHSPTLYPQLQRKTTTLTTTMSKKWSWRNLPMPWKT